MRDLKMADLMALRDRTTNPQQRAQWDALIADLIASQPVRPERARSPRSAVPRPARSAQSAARRQPTTAPAMVEPIPRQPAITPATVASILFWSMMAIPLYWLLKAVYIVLKALLWLFTTATQ